MRNARRLICQRSVVVLSSLCCALMLAVPSNMTAGAETVPVQVCAEDRVWQRPPPEEMARTVWRDNRYVCRSTTGVDVWPVLIPYYTQHFLLFTQISSGMSHAMDLTGLMPAHPPNLCAPSIDLERGATVEIWAFGYHVDGAELTTDTLTLTVDANASSTTGYAIVHVPRPQIEAWTARFRLPDGTPVATASPVHDVLPATDTQTPDASLPAGLPHPEEGSSLLDGAGSIVLDGSGRLAYARYLALVPDGTTTSQEADRYQNAIATAGFTTSTPATNADGSAMFSFVASPSPDALSGTVLVEEPSSPDIAGVMSVSLIFTYQEGS
jgi:hypothetical protein